VGFQKVFNSVRSVTWGKGETKKNLWDGSDTNASNEMCWPQ
jgi:hypothetical protein